MEVVLFFVFPHCLLIFIVYIFLFLFSFILSPGIFCMFGSLLSFSATNSTFANITSLHPYTCGGAIYIRTPNYGSFTIDSCVFTLCKAGSGGALYLHAPYIFITRTRFENNRHYSFTYGTDIYVVGTPCFNDVLNDSLSSSVCSTALPGNRTHCHNASGGDNDTSQLESTCSEEVVCEASRFYLFIFFFFFVIFSVHVGNNGMTPKMVASRAQQGCIAMKRHFTYV
jgi:hypothetical protein